MSLDNVIAQFIGFLYGLAFTIFVVIYMKLRERIARLEWGFRTGDKKSKDAKSKKPKEA